MAVARDIYSCAFDGLPRTANDMDVEIRALLIILEEGDSMGLPVISVTRVVLRGLEETGFSDAGKSY